MKIQMLADSCQNWALGRADAAATIHRMATRPRGRSHWSLWPEQGPEAGSLPLASCSLPVTLLVGFMTGEAQGHQEGWGRIQGTPAEEGTRGPRGGGGRCHG